MRLCRVEDVPAGGLKQFNVTQFNVEEAEVLVANLGGRFSCLSARCTHAGAPLVFGELREDVLTCPWHYSRFRVTDGSVLNGPAMRPLRLYPSLVKDGYLFVELESYV